MVKKIIETVKINFKIILNTTLKISGGLYSLLTILLTFFSWSEIGIDNKYYRLLILLMILVIALIVSVIYICLLKKEVTVWKKGNGIINVCYNDLMKLSFENNKHNKKIIVIPVNSCFDTVVDEDITKVEKPLVSPNTIHGRWINKMIQNGVSLEELDNRIKNNLISQKIEPIYTIPKEEKKIGKSEEYEQGTIAIVKGKNDIDFFLLALSRFDKNNNAQCTKDELIEVIHKLIMFYNKNGQGYDLYLPLMGTNLSRVGINHQEALNILKSSFRLYSDEIHGRINIVVYNKEKDRIPIC